MKKAKLPRVSLTMTPMQLARVEAVDMAALCTGRGRRYESRDWRLNTIIEHGLQAIEAAQRAKEAE